LEIALLQLWPVANPRSFGVKVEVGKDLGLVEEDSSFETGAETIVRFEEVGGGCQRRGKPLDEWRRSAFWKGSEFNLRVRSAKFQRGCP